MLLGWSDLEVLDDRGVEQCGQVALADRRRRARQDGGGRFSVGANAATARGGGVRQRQRRVGSGHESGEVVHTAADAISRPE